MEQSIHQRPIHPHQHLREKTEHFPTASIISSSSLCRFWIISWISVVAVLTGCWCKQCLSAITNITRQCNHKMKMENMKKTTHHDGVAVWTDDDLDSIPRRSKVAFSALPVSSASGWADNFDPMCCRHRSYHSNFTLYNKGRISTTAVIFHILTSHTLRLQTWPAALDEVISIICLHCF